MGEPPNKMRRVGPRTSCNNQDASLEKMEISSSSNFRDIRNAPTFVDKSLLIKDLFEGRKYPKKPVVLVTAPRRFGKSVNMSMIKHFLEKQVDSITGTEIPSNHQDSNTTLFANLKIMEHEKFVEEHFGKYAVLKCSYLCPNPITDKQETLKFYKGVIHNAYEEHRYLCKSSRLSQDQRNNCKKWCHDNDYLKCDDALVSDALKNLSKYLYLHYERKFKVFVLVDEYDSLFSKAMLRIKDKDVLKDVIDQGIAMLCHLVKDNDYVTGAFLTGISHISGLSLSSALGNVSSHRFLKKHNKIIAYYGFSQSEVDCLFKNCDIEEAQQESAKLYYNGYQSEDGKYSMYNPWSITFFIDNGEIDNYWVTSGAVQGLLPALRNEEIKTEIEDALLGNEDSNVECLDWLDESHFYLLHALISESKEMNCIPTSDVFFTFLLEQGYLAFCKGKGSLKIPNEEVRLDLHKKLTQHFVKTYKLKDSDKNNCKISFCNLFSSQTADTTVLITDLKHTIQEYVKPLKEHKTTPNHHILQQILFCPLFETKYRYFTEIRTEEHKRPDFFLYLKDRAAIIEVKYEPGYNSPSNGPKQALWQILEKSYYTLFGDAKYFKDFAKTFVLIGLSFNSELQVSMHCLSSHKISAYNHLTTKEGLQKQLRKDDIETLLTMADVVSLNSVTPNKSDLALINLILK